jgi:hypothetical protein
MAIWRTFFKYETSLPTSLYSLHRVSIHYIPDPANSNFKKSALNSHFNLLLHPADGQDSTLRIYHVAFWANKPSEAFISDDYCMKQIN